MNAAPRPRMKTAAPLLRGGGQLHIVRSDDVVTFDDPDGAMHRLVELADGSRSTNELYRALANEYPRVHHGDVVEAVSRLEEADLLEHCPPHRGELGGRDQPPRSGLL